MPSSNSNSLCGPSSVRYWLMALVLLQWVSSLQTPGILGVFVAGVCVVTLIALTGDGSSSNDESILFGIAIFAIIITAIHVILATFALLAEFQKKPKLLTPWIYYLNFILVMGVLSGILSLIQLNVRALSSQLFSLGLTYITLRLSKERKAQMETTDKGYVINNQAEA